jgi:D-aminoacyl-tRNA deacylase
MRAVIQRVSSAQVVIDGQVVGAIGTGFVILLGVGQLDTAEDGLWLAEKIAALRIFPDDAGLMNQSVRDVAGEALVISQFTLFASTRKGTRPSFNDAAKPDVAIPLYESFIAQLETALGKPVQRGRFGADMKVTLTNDGPVTLVIDTKSRE